MKNLNLYEVIWISVFSIAALILALTQKDNILGLSTFITGIFCVLLAAKGNIMTYAFGLYNTFAYAYISYTNGLYGEMGLNILFFIPMNVLGFIFWKKRLHNNIVDMRRLKNKEVGIVMSICILSIAILGWMYH